MSNSQRFLNSGFVVPAPLDKNAGNRVVWYPPFDPSPNFTSPEEHDFISSRRYHLVVLADGGMRCFSDMEGVRWANIDISRTRTLPGITRTMYRTARELSNACFCQCYINHFHNRDETEGRHIPRAPKTPGEYVVWTPQLQSQPQLQLAPVCCPTAKRSRPDPIAYDTCAAAPSPATSPPVTSGFATSPLSVASVAEELKTPIRNAWVHASVLEILILPSAFQRQSWWGPRGQCPLFIVAPRTCRRWKLLVV
ncbi:hypothetical protein B0H17DRAFT_1220101 [Mycena rosella]|uniref:Uncharacterized protein n=1 Tax=Mycena rosella TaxID=1033263 RepID=A0AAD7BDU5_MYCRO|nr:hypothetical protein B0H17DRAFT_1220101 [Mycena rosella]